MALVTSPLPSSLKTPAALYKTITIDPTKVVGGSDLTNYPMLFSGAYSYLATLANGGRVTNSSGYDILFSSDIEGKNLLSFEIESYSPTTGEVNFWVKIPTLSTSVDTVIYLWYSNPNITTSQENIANVWPTYSNVWHLSGLSDSRGGNTLTQSTTTLQPVKIANGRYLTVDSSNLTFTSGLAPSGNFAIEFWLQKDADDQQGVVFTKNSTAENYIFAYAGNFLELNLNGDRRQYSNITSFTALKHFTIVEDGVNQTLFVNGSQLQQLSSLTGFTWDRIGNYGGGFSIIGKIDEVRYLQGGTLDSGWIGTNYNNQNSPSTFYAITG